MSSFKTPKSKNEPNKKTKSPDAATQKALLDQKLENERLRKEARRLEAERMAREMDDLFGDEIFAEPALNPVKDDKIIRPPVAIVVKKSATITPDTKTWPLGDLSKPTIPKPSTAPPRAPTVKISASAPKKIFTAAPVKTSAFAPSPLPEVKLASNVSSAPTLAEFRAGLTSKPKPTPPVKPKSSVLYDSESESSEDSDSSDEAFSSPNPKKRQASSELDEAWKQLREITGYNPLAPKFKERDRIKLSEGSFEDIQKEERRSKKLGKLEDQREEEELARRAREKAERLRKWKERHQEDESESESESESE